MATHAGRSSEFSASHSVNGCAPCGAVRASRSVSLKSNSLPRNPRSRNPFPPAMVAVATAAAIRPLITLGSVTNPGRKTVSSYPGAHSRTN